MKINIRKYRLVLACIKWTGSLMNLIAALVNMASNYFNACDTKVVKSI